MMKKSKPIESGTSKRKRSSHKVHENACHACGTVMHASTAAKPVQINGEIVLVRGIPHLRCPNCDETLTLAQNLQLLWDRGASVYRDRHGLLDADDIRAIRTRHRLTQAQLAKLLGLGTNTLSRWEAGRIVQTTAMDVLLRLVRDVPGNLAYLRRHRA